MERDEGEEREERRERGERRRMYIAVAVEIRARVRCEYSPSGRHQSCTLGEG